jgi:hypothetical protein
MCAAVIASMLGGVPAALAVREIATEEDIADLLTTPVLTLKEAEEAAKERQWAILPEIGYDPESGGDGGLKFTIGISPGWAPRSTPRRPTRATVRRA